MQIYSGNYPLSRRVKTQPVSLYSNTISDGDRVKIAKLKPGSQVASVFRTFLNQNPTSLGRDELDIPIEEAKTIHASDSDYPIYTWCSNGKIKIWSQADVLKANANSSGLFNGLTTVETIDLTGIDFIGVTNLSSFFYQDSSLTTVIGLDKLDTSAVTNFSGMFYGASYADFDIINQWDFSSAATMGTMFQKNTCAGEANFVLQAPLVTTVSGMFRQSSFSKINVTFKNCGILYNISYAFCNNQNVTEITVKFIGDSWLKPDSLNVTAGNLFYNNPELTLVDLRGWSGLPKIWSGNAMFANNPKLTKIKVDKLWQALNNGEVLIPLQQFNSSPNIVGDNGTVWDDIKQWDYMKIDYGESDPGLLSAGPVVFIRDDTKGVLNGMPGKWFNAAIRNAYDQDPAWLAGSSSLGNYTLHEFDYIKVDTDAVPPDGTYYNAVLARPGSEANIYVWYNSDDNGIIISAPDALCIMVPTMGGSRASGYWSVGLHANTIDIHEINGYYATQIMLMHSESYVKRIDRNSFPSNLVNVVNADTLCYWSYGTEQIDIEDLDLPKVESFYHAFSGCEHVAKLRFTGNFGMAHDKVISIKELIINSYIEQVEIIFKQEHKVSLLSAFDEVSWGTGGKVAPLNRIKLQGFHVCESMQYAFFNLNMTELDLTALKLDSSILNWDYAFYNNDKLERIYVDPSFTLAAGAYGPKTFELCTKLKGTFGTTIDEIGISYAGARIDTLEQAGLFSTKGAILHKGPKINKLLKSLGNSDTVERISYSISAPGSDETTVNLASTGQCLAWADMINSIRIYMPQFTTPEMQQTYGILPEDASYIFEGFPRLQELDISWLDFRKAQTLVCAFANNPKLVSIIAREDQDLYSGNTTMISTHIFFNSRKIIGQYGTSVRDDVVPITMAHVDTIDNPGYFKSYVPSIFVEMKGGSQKNIELKQLFNSSAGTETDVSVDNIWWSDEGVPASVSKTVNLTQTGQTYQILAYRNGNDIILTPDAPHLHIHGRLSGEEPYYLFRRLGIKGKVDISHIDFSQATKMRDMFSFNHIKSTEDILGFTEADFNNVIDFGHVIAENPDLTYIKYANNLHKVQDLSYVGRNDTKLEVVDMSEIDVTTLKNLTSTTGMFQNSPALKTVYVPEELANWPEGMGYVRYQGNEFAGCVSIVGVGKDGTTCTWRNGSTHFNICAYIPSADHPFGYLSYKPKPI